MSSLYNDYNDFRNFGSFIGGLVIICAGEGSVGVGEPNPYEQMVWSPYDLFYRFL